MRLLEAILEANHRAVAGDDRAGLHPADFADALPLVALTCIDARLNPLMPEVLAIPEDKFIWLRNAGNIIFDPFSSMMRTLALACAVKGGREITIIGHTDCLVRKTSTMELLDRFQALGIDRARLPENLTEFFGLFSSERQNVLRGTEIVRSSPLIGPAIPVHGLLVDIQTGRLEWLVNGYQTLDTARSTPNPTLSQTAQSLDALKDLLPFHLGEMKFPGNKIGELASQLEQASPKLQEAAKKIGHVAEQVGELAGKAGQWLAEVHVHAPAQPDSPAPPKVKMTKPIPRPPPMPAKQGPPPNPRK